ncbi:MAG: hypothetical protein K0S81_4068 [Rhodospirillales bacterium]|nr:hypothetical protein [Rhodospirillales bacterium]
MKVNWFLFKRVTRALWFLPALFSAFALLVLAAAYFSNIFFPEPINPDRLPITVSQEAVESILSIVAASMLTVAVFALSTLVSLLANASHTGSPRAVPLIVEDRRAQTSISVFLGAFLFSIVGLSGCPARFTARAAASSCSVPPSLSCWRSSSPSSGGSGRSP